MNKGAPNFLPYLLDPLYCGSKLALTESEKTSAFTFAIEKCFIHFMPIIIKFLGKADPIYDFLFQKDVVSKMSPLKWWKTIVPNF